MSIVEAAVLGAIQGIAEFLPISSSGHLALAQHLLGLKQTNTAFVLILHLPTLAAIVGYYRKRLLELATTRRRELMLIILATLPMGLLALVDKRLESLHDRPALIGLMLIGNGAFLYIAHRWSGGAQAVGDMPAWKAVLIGLAQALRVPGLSRSGSTIGTAWLLRLDRQEAVAFSFILSIPAVLGSIVWKARKVTFDAATVPVLPTLVGVVVALALSLACIRLVEFLARGRLWLALAAYSAAVGLAALLYFGLR
jgi:undecaprenyl-diphosphatase